MVVYH